MSIGGILPVIPTPFAAGRFDAGSFERLLEHMGDAVDGFVLLGSTGEAPSLSVADRQAIAARALELTPSTKRVVVGVTHTALPDTVALARHAEAHGAAAVLCASPFYFPNSPDGLRRYLGHVDEAIGIELIFYDNPEATKTTVSAADVIAWARDLEHLNSVKLTDHDLTKVRAWQEAGLTVLAGDDPIAFRYMAAGVDGAMMIVPAVMPEAFRAAWDSVRADDLKKGYEIFGMEVAPFSHAFGIGDEIATTKALLADLGVFSSAEVLAPLSGCSHERLRLVRAAYDLCRHASTLRLTSP